MANIFDGIKKWFTYQKKSFWTALGSSSLSDVASMPTNRDYLDSYEASFLVYACVKKIAQKVANTKFKLYKVNGGLNSEKIDEVRNSPLLDLLAKVNPLTTKFQMLDETQTSLELLGNSYWLKVRSETGNKILELWQLRADRVRIVEDGQKIVGGYVYQNLDGTTVSFATEDIIHFKQVNPKSFLYGLPTVKAIMEIVQSSIFAIRWNKNFFYNQAKPDGILMLKGSRKKSEIDELEKQWKEKFGGVSNSHKTFVAEGEIDYKNLTETQREMDFAKLDEVSTAQILSAFGVPKSILGMQGMNRAEAEAQIYTFLSETIEPKIQTIIESLNEFLVPEFGSNLYLDFEDPTPENRELVLKEYQASLGQGGMPWRTINEIRNLEGLPPMDGGDDIYVPVMNVPLSEANQLIDQDVTKGYLRIKGMSQKAYKKFKEEKEQEALKRKILPKKRQLKLEMELKDTLKKMFIKQRKVFTTAQKKMFWNEHDKLLSSDIKVFRIVVRKLMEGQEERFKESLSSYISSKGITKSVSDIVDWETEKTIFAQVSIPVLGEIIRKRGDRALKIIGVNNFRITDRIKEFINEKGEKFSERVNDTTADKLNASLAEGINDGEGIEELSQRVADVFKVRKNSGCKMIARTEVISVSNEADIEAYKQLGVVKKKEWLATMDDRVREEHAELNGEVVGIDEEFSNGLLFPGDPRGDAEDIINCRCAILPVVEE